MDLRAAVYNEISAILSELFQGRLISDHDWRGMNNVEDLLLHLLVALNRLISSTKELAGELIANNLEILWLLVEWCISPSYKVDIAFS